VRLLLDTQLLLWASAVSSRLPASLISRLEDENTELLFSAASIWEVAIKSVLGRADFSADPNLLRRALLENGYGELSITGLHGAYVASLPPLHKDPFDRILVAQAALEGAILLTVDRTLASYPGPIERVA
jgi:PIN domain nuclease of toxin-antitoxin system